MQARKLYEKNKKSMKDKEDDVTSRKQNQDEEKYQKPCDKKWILTISAKIVNKVVVQCARFLIRGVL